MIFHLNPYSGTVSKCHAEKGNCPYGGDSGTENHFESVRDARTAYERMKADDTFRTHNKETLEKTFIAEESADSIKVQKLKEEERRVSNEQQKLDRIIRGIVRKNPNFVRSQKWYDMVQERKALMYRSLALKQERLDLLPPEIARQERYENEQKVAQKKARRDEWFNNLKQTGDFNYHPEITESNESQVVEVISSYSGLTADEISEHVDAQYVLGAKSLTEAYERVWREMPLRKDKPLVAIDLETASPDLGDGVDLGPYSTIIEIGYIIRQPNGGTIRKSYLCGLSDDCAKGVGTGREDVHGITPDMLKSLKPLTEDPARMKELTNDLRGSVIVAHNARFEVSQLSHSLPGFSGAIARGEVEVLDTRKVNMFFHRETESNSNQDFVEATGGKYTDAHRADKDARMTLDALLRSRNLPDTTAR